MGWMGLIKDEKKMAHEINLLVLWQCMHACVLCVAADASTIIGTLVLPNGKVDVAFNDLFNHPEMFQSVTALPVIT